METPRKAFSARPETDWMNDPSVSIVEHIGRVNNFDYDTMDLSLVSRYKAHEANIQQKEIRRNSALGFRASVLARRALIDTI